MNRLQVALRNVSENGMINLPSALKVAIQFDEDERESLNLLAQCKSQVGMTIGEDIRKHEAKIRGTFFNEKEFHYEHPVGEQ